MKMKWTARAKFQLYGLNLWASSMMARAKFIAFTAITKAILMDITITLSAQDHAKRVMKI